MTGGRWARERVPRKLPPPSKQALVTLEAGIECVRIVDQSGACRDEATCGERAFAAASGVFVPSRLARQMSSSF